MNRPRVHPARASGHGVARFVGFHALVLASLAACQGDGTDVGPQFDALPNPQLAGRVLDDAGRPVAGARVRADGRVATTDEFGRFRLEEVHPGEHDLVLDGSIASTASGGSAFASYAVPVSYPGGRFTLGRPLVAPELARGATLRLPVGVPLPGGTALSDPGTGTRLLLGGSVLSFADPAARPGVTEVDVHLTVLEPDAVPGAVDLAPARPGIFQNGLVAVLEPPDLRLTASQLLLANALSLPDGAPSRAVRLARMDGAWVDLGAAQTGAGSVDLGATVDRAGLYSHARLAIPDFELTTIVGQVTDGGGVPRGGFVVSAGARSTRSRNDGTFALPDVVATDGSGAPRALTVRVEAPAGFRAEAVVAAVTPNPGGITAAPSLRLAALPTTDVQVLVVERGLAADARRVTVGTVTSGAHRARSDADGQVLFRDVVRARRAGAGAHERDDDRERFANSDRIQFELQGPGRRRVKLFLGELRLRARRFRGSTSVRVVVRGTSAPIENAFALAGLDGTRAARRGITQFNGLAQIDTVQPRPAILTAGIRTELPATDGVHDRVRQISYRTFFGLERRGPTLGLAVADDPGRPAPRAPYGVFAGSVLGATDPAVVPPQGQGYAIAVLGQRRARRGELQADLLGLADFLPTLRADLPRRRPTATFADPRFSVAVDTGLVDWLAVERDVDASGVGPLVQAGLGDPLRILETQDGFASVALTVPARAIVPVAVVGLDARLAGGAPEVGFAWTGRDERAVFGGPLTDARWLGAQSLEARWVDPPQALPDGRAFLVAGVRGATPDATLEQRAVALEPGTVGFAFPEVPDLLVPAPGQPFLPQDSGPTGGLWFQRDPASGEVSFTRITLTRSRVVVENGRKILERYEWVLDVSNDVPEGLAANQVVFPTLPERVREIQVPAFFFPGSYDVLLEHVRAADFEFGRYAAFRDVLPLEDQDVRAVARYRTTVVVP